MLKYSDARSVQVDYPTKSLIISSREKTFIHHFTDTEDMKYTVVLYMSFQ